MTQARHLYHPVVADGVLYAATLGSVGSANHEGPYYNRIYALEASTGELLWQYETEDSLDPILAVAGGVVFAASDSNIYALKASTGRLHWRYEADEDVDSGPSVADGIVYFGTDDYLYALYNSTNN